MKKIMDLKKESTIPTYLIKAKIPSYPMMVSLIKVNASFWMA